MEHFLPFLESFGEGRNTKLQVVCWFLLPSSGHLAVLLKQKVGPSVRCLESDRLHALRSDGVFPFCGLSTFARFTIEVLTDLKAPYCRKIT